MDGRTLIAQLKANIWLDISIYSRISRFSGRSCWLYQSKLSGFTTIAWTSHCNTQQKGLLFGLNPFPRQLIYCWPNVGSGLRAGSESSYYHLHLIPMRKPGRKPRKMCNMSATAWCCIFSVLRSTSQGHVVCLLMSSAASYTVQLWSSFVVSTVQLRTERNGAAWSAIGVQQTQVHDWAIPLPTRNIRCWQHGGHEIHQWFSDVRNLHRSPLPICWYFILWFWSATWMHDN